MASATDEQTTEQLAATPEPAAPKVADGNCGNSNCAIDDNTALAG